MASRDLKDRLAALAAALRSAQVEKEIAGLIDRGPSAATDLQGDAPALAALLRCAAQIASQCGLDSSETQDIASTALRTKISSPNKSRKASRPKSRRADTGGPDVKRPSKNAGERRMEQDQIVETLVSRIANSEPTDAARRELISELRSNSASINKSQMQAIARAVIGATFKTKKEAQNQLEAWIAHRARAAAEGRRIYESQASG